MTCLRDKLGISACGWVMSTPIPVSGCASLVLWDRVQTDACPARHLIQATGSTAQLSKSVAGTIQILWTGRADAYVTLWTDRDPTNQAVVRPTGLSAIGVHRQIRLRNLAED